MTTPPEDYKDICGNPIALEALVRAEPEWAVSRLRMMRDRDSERVIRLTIAGNALAAALYLHTEVPECDPVLIVGSESALAGWDAATKRNDE